MPSLAHDIAFFVALLATGIALGGALAHAFELPNKIGLPADEYFIVQKAYRGWNQLGYVLVIQIAAMIVVSVMSRHRPAVRWSVLVAILCLLLAQTLFWIYTYPANVATADWTVMPPDWEALRRRWEYSHAAGAALQLLAMAALIVAVLARSRS